MGVSVYCDRTNCENNHNGCCLNLGIQVNSCGYCEDYREYKTYKDYLQTQKNQRIESEVK